MNVSLSLGGGLPLCNSFFFAAGATVPKKEVIDVIKKFNIQVNNLTQVGLHVCLQLLSDSSVTHLCFLCTLELSILDKSYCRASPYFNVLC